MTDLAARKAQVFPTEDAFRAAFSPIQAEILIAALALRPKDHLSAKEAAEAVGWTYDTFRKEPVFDAANVAPANRRKRYARSKLLRIAGNLKSGR